MRADIELRVRFRLPSLPGRVLHLLVLGLAPLMFPASRSSAATVGLYADAACTQTHMNLPSGTEGTIYVAYTGSLPLQGVEFRIDGIPTNWAVLSVVPNPAALVLGDPLGTGVGIGFPMPEGTDCVNLFTIVVAQTSPGSAATLTVTHREPPRPDFPCPFAIFYCGAPCDSWGCCEGGQLLVDATVGTPEQPWSKVKQLYLVE